MDACIGGHGRNRRRRGALAGGNVWWVVPKIDDADHAYRHAQKALVEVAVPNKSKRRFEFANGGILWIRSADDPQGLRGPALDGVVFDEYRNIHPDAWTDSIRPALSDRLGWAMFISTPNAHDHFYELYDRAEELDNWQRWHFPTWANPKIRQSELEAARLELGERKYLREYGAEFIVSVGSEWDSSCFSKSIIIPKWPDYIEHLWIQVDPSYGKKKSDLQGAVAVGTIGDKGDSHYYIEAKGDRMPVRQFAEELADWELPREPYAYFIEETVDDEGFGLMSGALREALFARGRINDPDDTLFVRTVGNNRIHGWSKEQHILANLDRPIRDKDFKFVDCKGSRLTIAQARGFDPNEKNQSDDLIDSLARSMDSGDVVASEIYA